MPYDHEPSTSEINCGNCKFSRPIRNRFELACIRFPPTVSQGRTVWPRLNKECECGEHKPKISTSQP